IDAARPEEMSIFLRIPGWAKETTVRVNDRPVAAPAKRGTFHEVRRTWSAGDRIDLELPMPMRIVQANPYVEEARNQLAVMRGPMVYCLESVDLPRGVRLLDV